MEETIEEKNKLYDYPPFFTGFTDELPFSGSVGVCTPVPTVTTFGLQRLSRVGLHHGGVQDVLPAQSDQTLGLLLQLHCCEFSCYIHGLFLQAGMFLKTCLLFLYTTTKVDNINKFI